MQCFFFNCNILHCAPITELFWACLVVSQVLGEGALVQMFCWYIREKRGGVSSAWRHVRTALRIALWTSGTKDLRMVPCHSCHIYGIWTSTIKKVWGMLKSNQLGVAMQVTKGGALFIGKAGSHCVCNTVVL